MYKHIPDKLIKIYEQEKCIVDFRFSTKIAKN